MTLNTGQLLQQRYHITSHIGQGGMGAVYQAQDMRLGNRLVAVKEFDPAQLPPSDRQIALQAFQQEAAILARLSHPGLTAVTDYFTENNRFYLVMEFVEGETLQRAWERVGRRFAEAQVMAWAQELCDVLNYLHSQQPPIIFRDLKPGNIMVQPNGRLKLIDFGIARHFTPGKTSDTVKFGTPGYASPEQYGQGQTDARSDVYALGVVVHQLLTGHEPGMTPFSLPDMATFPIQVSPAVITAVQQAVQLDANQRPSTATMFCQMLTIQPPVPKRPVWVWIGGVLLLVGVTAVLLRLFLSSQTPPTPTVTPSTFELNPQISTVIVTETPPAETTTEAEIVVSSPLDSDSPTPTDTPSPTPTAVPALQAGTTAQRPQDSQPLVFVPAGTMQMGAASNTPDIAPESQEMPAHEISLDAFWIDQTEVTNAQFADFLNANDNRVEGSEGNTWINLNEEFSLISGSNGNYTPKPGAAERPAIMVTWYGAAAYCGWIGGSLPTEAQWEYAARGPENRIYPWGNEVDSAPLNFCDTNCKYEHRNTAFDDGFAEAGPVGSYANGRSWVGALDMAGNTWEWVTDWYAPYETAAATNPSGPSSGNQKILRGGSWGDSLNDSRSSVRQPYSPDARNGLVGFRCVMAETAVAPAQTTALSNAEETANVAEPTSPPSLGSTRIASSDAMTQLYIPAGEFSMGNSTGNSDEKPVHSVYLDAYWLDQTEVSNAQFAQFAVATSHQTTAESAGVGWIYDGGWQAVDNAYWREPQGTGSNATPDHPVVQVSWYDAQAYCEWVGRRLPSEAEWEKAARSDDQRAYPWGDTFDGTYLNFCDANCTSDVSANDSFAGTAPVGSYPTGASPYGVLDMAGNVFEWVADWYGGDYYAASPTEKPMGPADGQYKVMRGGSWQFSQNAALTTAREVSNPAMYNDSVGFRCAQDNH